MQLEILLYFHKLVSFYANNGTKMARNRNHTRWSMWKQAENKKQFQDDHILQSFLFSMILEAFGPIFIPEIAGNLSKWILCFDDYTEKMA